MKKTRGFTLLELVIVLVLIGILSSYALIKTSGSHSLLLRAHAEQLQQQIKHTQLLAMSWGQSLTMTLTATSYQVTCSAGIGSSPCDQSPVVDPVTGQAFKITLQDNVSLLDTGSIEFDALGRPRSGGSVSPSDSTWRLSDGDSQDTVTLRAISGSVSL